MTYTINRDGDRLDVRVSGRLDINTSPELEEALMGQLEGITLLTIDFTELSYISSMGLRLLLALQKRMDKQGALTITGIRGQVAVIFEETGFSEIFTIV